MPGPKGKSGIALGALLMVAAPLIVHYEGNVPHTYADVNGVATGEARELARVFLVVHLAFAVAFLTALLRARRAASAAEA